MSHTSKPPAWARRGLEKGISSRDTATDTRTCPATQAVVYVRADRRGVVVERPGAAPWIFPPARSVEAIELARTAAKLFGARLIVELDRGPT
jgi:hypothetical protein